MKRVLLKVVMLMLCISILLISATETIVNAHVIENEQYFPEEYVGYRYRVLPGTSEWKELSNHQEMVDACEIPSEVIDSLSTEELLQTILYYPLLADMYAYSDFETGLEIVAKHFGCLMSCFQGKIMQKL